ncbi:monovalent cation/H+ antiporter subunit D [Thiohalorhabdus sp.]|uniref:monovalent cation/H+ antiporter subunit D n=1 Tax=Thiohalorhabdus sp. TaxID=3094134 RepID=UPI002FC3B875
MSQALILPVLIPLVAGVIQVPWRSIEPQRVIAFVALAAQAVVAVWLLSAAASEPAVFRLGGWEAPHGIVLVGDRLGTLMLALSTALAAAVLVYVVVGDDKRGRAFHPLFQFQLAGLAMAFLTGDLFNLFVAFEVLLIASYGLLLHGGGGRRHRSAFHYVMLNLAGSLLFLVALGLLYRVAGTLNMAQLGPALAELSGTGRAVAEAAVLLLVAVFGLKAAAFPLSVWLGATYGAALVPVAALFAIMTKVGIYAILRLDTTVLAGLDFGIGPVLHYAGLATVAVGALGTLAAERITDVVSYLLLVSVGTLLLAFGLPEAAGLRGGLYYLVHTTLVTAGLYLLGGVIARQRVPLDDGLQAGAPLAQPLLLGALFTVGAVAVIGLPPLSGFLGKLMILQAPLEHGQRLLGIWAALLGAALVALFVLARAGSTLFWKQGMPSGPQRTAPWGTLVPPAVLLAASVALAAAAGPADRWLAAAADDLRHSEGYRTAVIGEDRGGQP